MAKFEIPTEATRPLYAGVGATDLVVGYVRDAVADVQKRFDAIEREPKALRDQALAAVTTQIDALSKDVKAGRAAIEARVAELQSRAVENASTVNSTYADLVKRGEVLLGRVRNQESTKRTASSAKTTTTKAKTTTTQAKKAAKKTTKSTAKKASTTAKKTSTAPKSSAKATATAAKKTASNAAQATTDAAAKVGD